MVIWKDIAVPIRNKEYHINKIGKHGRVSFINTYGDVPVARINEITGNLEAVVNNRGRAYAARKRQAYRSRNKVV